MARWSGPGRAGPGRDYEIVMGQPGRAEKTEFFMCRVGAGRGP